MIDYAKFLDDTDGLRSATYENGFNNILFSSELIVGKYLNGMLEQADIDLYMSHCMINEDSIGGYKPKNSHDNITGKIVAMTLLKQDSVLKRMKLLPLIWAIGFYRIWDVVLYVFLLGGSVGRFLMRPFMFIPALQMIHACWKAGKVRPELPERIMLALQGKPCAKVLYQNDGKILSPLKLVVLVDKSWTMKYTAKVCQSILEKRYGENYMYSVFANYFKESDHPVRLAWKPLTKLF